jgi:hypothetical protein
MLTKQQEPYLNYTIQPFDGSLMDRHFDDEIVVKTSEDSIYLFPNGHTDPELD